ncbi:uncharacterized protein LOC131949127 isoform X3 [Physella acuta]|uniref:uncharacterized protein LOC131949127 isoform X3 n=1 Tax=Physella acuta TaxID=109671 RepID=UPI0027DD5590|nr:uncharacterized protein LOC131949127 isoform X3 [Physella acuta]
MGDTVIVLHTGDRGCVKQFVSSRCTSFLSLLISSVIVLIIGINSKVRFSQAPVQCLTGTACHYLKEIKSYRGKSDKCSMTHSCPVSAHKLLRLYTRLPGSENLQDPVFSSTHRVLLTFNLTTSGEEHASGVEVLTDGFVIQTSDPKIFLLLQLVCEVRLHVSLAFLVFFFPSASSHIPVISSRPILEMCHIRFVLSVQWCQV